MRASPTAEVSHHPSQGKAWVQAGFLLLAAAAVVRLVSDADVVAPGFTEALVLICVFGIALWASQT